MQQQLTRRNLLLAASTLKAANNRIRLGLIGTGGRMRDHLNELARIHRAGTENFSISAICDVYRPNREAAAARVEKEYGAKPLLINTRYQDLLASKDVDAVIIATPDFSHPVILEAAIRAGKDVSSKNRSLPNSRPRNRRFSPPKPASPSFKSVRSAVRTPASSPAPNRSTPASSAKSPASTSTTTSRNPVGAATTT